MSDATATQSAGDETRFRFGKNWSAFLRVLDEDRIDRAGAGLCGMIDAQDLRERSFLDIGSGSGLMSLAAHRLGASVTSFDYDIDSVRCTEHLRREYGTGTAPWAVSEGSVLDEQFMNDLGQFDIVYSWGVLHHTGDMWAAIDKAGLRVKSGGSLFIAIYNDQGNWSSRWWRIKKAYCESRVARALIVGSIVPYWVLRNLAADLVWGRNPSSRYRDYRKKRGMSIYHDWLDWLGGFPFEVAKPEDVIDFLSHRGFRLERLKTAGGSLGCNEFVLRKE